MKRTIDSFFVKNVKLGPDPSENHNQCSDTESSTSQVIASPGPETALDNEHHTIESEPTEIKRGKVYTFRKEWLDQFLWLRYKFSTSAALLQYGLRKVDIPPPESSKFYFDTHAVVRLLEDQGLSTSQAEVIVASLIQILKSFVELVHKDMVTKVQQEIMLQQVMSHIASVKKDMVILEKSEFTALRAENEDEMNKVRSDAIMDMNLEKSRVKEMYAEHEKNLLERRSEIVELHAEQDKAVTQTIRKIDTEVAGLKTMLESHKLDTIKYLAVFPDVDDKLQHIDSFPFSKKDNLKTLGWVKHFLISGLNQEVDCPEGGAVINRYNASAL
ncbi:MCUR1 regulator, partial [Polypterus senegalus]